MSVTTATQVTKSKVRDTQPRQLTGIAAATLLRDIGLLFYINWQAAHPLGLTIGLDGDGNLIVTDHRSQPDCMLSPSDFAAGLTKLSNYMDKRGNETTTARKQLTGHYRQPLPKAKAG